MKELDAILEKFLLEKYRDVFVKDWRRSGHLLNNGDFFSERNIEKNAQMTGIDDDFIPHITAVAEKIVNSSLLKRLFVHAHYLLFICKDSPDSIGSDFPDMKEVLNDDSFTYNLLLVLSGIRLSVDYFRSMDMPEDVIKGAIQDVSIWVKYFHNELGVIGINPRILNWERELMRGSLFRLGRLQFNIRPFGGKIFVFKNKFTHQVQALLEKDIFIDSSGQFESM